MSAKNPYQVLEIKPTATTDEIRRAFRRLALQSHPDRNPGDPDAAVRFRELTSAYNTLSDPSQRRDVDGRLRSLWRQLMGSRGNGKATATAGAGAASAAKNGEPTGARQARGGILDALFGAGKARDRRERDAARAANGSHAVEQAVATNGPGAPHTPPPPASGAAAEAPSTAETATPRHTPPIHPPAPDAAPVRTPLSSAPMSPPPPAPSPAPANGAARERPIRGENRIVVVEVPFELAAVGGRHLAVVSLDRPCPNCGGRGDASAAPLPPCPDCGGRGSRPVLEPHASNGHGAHAAAAAPRAAEETVCARCIGLGYLVTTPCAECRGTGSAPVQREFTVSVPPCMEDLHSVRIPGEGEAGRHGGPAGDLILALRAARHPEFRRRGRDILARVRINLAQAMFGDTVSVPTLHGEVAVRLAAPMQPGTRLRLKGMGVGGARLAATDADGHAAVEIPRPDGEVDPFALDAAENEAGMPGDHYITLDVEIPRAMKKAERKKMYSFAKGLGMLDAMTFPPDDPNAKSKGAPATRTAPAPAPEQLQIVVNRAGDRRPRKN